MKLLSPIANRGGQTTQGSPKNARRFKSRRTDPMATRLSAKSKSPGFPALPGFECRSGRAVRMPAAGLVIKLAEREGLIRSLSLTHPCGAASRCSAVCRPLTAASARTLVVYASRVRMSQWSGGPDAGRTACNQVGGEGGIRTLEGLSTLPVFKTGAFNRSATSPTVRHIK